MQRQIAQVYGIVVGLLALAGLFIEEGHLFGIMNANWPLDVLRIVLASTLLYAGFSRQSDENLARSALGFTGALYIGLALLGLVDATLWGLLPSGLTGFDIFFHLATGIVAAAAALVPHGHHSPTHA